MAIAQPEDLQVIVFDCDEYGDTHTIGETAVPLSGLIRGKSMVKWYTLKKGGKEAGEIKLSVTAVDFGTIDPEKLPSVATVKKLKRSAGPPPKLGQIKKSEALVTNMAIQVPNIKFRRFAETKIRRRSEIGSGTFGVVHKGKIKGIEETIVIKDMNVSSHRRIIDEWKKEVELMKFTDCRYVCKVYGYSVTEQKLTIIMEWCERGSLYDVLYNKPPKHFKLSLSSLFNPVKDKDKDIKNLSIIQRLRMARHCVRGMCFLHQNDVLHCDIKSPNILVCKDYTCKLADFGCAKVVSDSSQDTRGIGSPLWAAPETKTSQYTFAADVYSMSLILYEIFEGTLPRWNRKEKIAVVPPTFLAKQVIKPCLVKEPDNRPTATGLLKSLDKWVNKMLKDIISILPKSMLNRAGLLNSRELTTGKKLNKVYNYLITRVDDGRVDELIAQLRIKPPAPHRSSNGRPKKS
mmetsp:Transcript_553/g.663  ORF Transcript_553/g.663 Transcript_553/m.663 type:complete len:460 (-) Transcript_553:157-1536(-)